MTTVDKSGKPAILTESDQILNDLKTELAQLRSRMSSIEQEQEQNRVLVERLSFQEELANRAIKSHLEEVEHNCENYKVIANVVHSLKSPVSSVVSNLSGIIAEIEDSDTQKTLEACMNTASNVLNSFDDVEDFCHHASTSHSSPRTRTNIRDFFRDLLSSYQTSEDHHQMDFRLLVDKQVPEKTVLHCEAIQGCVASLIEEIKHFNKNAEITIRISSEKQEEAYGFAIEDLSITIDWQTPSPIVWQKSWIVSIQENREQLVNSGLNLLKTRETIRKSGGHTEILTNGDSCLQGFKLFLPLTY